MKKKGKEKRIARKKILVAYLSVLASVGSLLAKDPTHCVVGTVVGLWLPWRSGCRALKVVTLSNSVASSNDLDPFHDWGLYRSSEDALSDRTGHRATLLTRADPVALAALPSNLAAICRLLDRLDPREE